MTYVNLARLLSLSAIWGASFLFMRVAAPVLGPVWLIGGRVACAALFLWPLALLLRRPLALRTYWKHYLVLGAINSALPFLLLAYSARTLTASLLAVLNATAPLFGGLIQALVMREPLGTKAAAGLVVGFMGVVILAAGSGLALEPGAPLAIAAGLAAALSYGAASVYARRQSGRGPLANAHGSMWAATLLVVPLLPLFPADAPATGGVIGAVVALGVVCSGIAYLLYFRLIQEVGAPAALTVTFLVPVFGILWGHLFLAEPIGVSTVLGTVTVLTGAAWVTGFAPLRWLLTRRPAHP